MSAETSRAVFLSYASQDAPAVLRIAEALRAAGIEVWFDQDELVGGDAWDQKIRRQIKECALFVPVISANTNARAEGYFRLEWKLAVDRSHLMADDAPFLFPVVIDDTSDAAARVPDKFREVQWTRLNVKDTPESLAARVAKILGGAGSTSDIARAARRGDDRAEKKSSPAWLRYVWAIFGLVVGLFWMVRPLWNSGRSRERPAAPAVEKSAALAPSAAPKLSEARQLAEKARALFDKINSNADDFAVAESLLKRALELDANDGEIWAYSARLNAGYLTRSFERNPARAEAARSQAERAVKLAPDSAEAWHALARGIWTSDLPRAEEALRHAHQLAPNDGRILLSLGSVCRLQGRTDDALAFYVQAAAHPDVKPLASYDQFLIHLYMRRYAEADRCVRESIAALPTTNNVSGLAMLEFAWRGRTEVAQRVLADAPAELRGEPRMVFATALNALVAKQTDEALRALDRLPGDFINDSWFAGPKALLVGLAHAQAGRPEAARIAWEAGLNVVRRRLEDASNDPELHLRLGELLAWTGQTDAALREARVFEELQRNRTDWTFSSARIYAALGRADEAVPILEKFLTVTATGRWPLTPVMLRLDPIWSKLRDDPRFQALCAEPKNETVAAPPPNEKSVAVLAFADNSPAHDSEYFSDGISEELINALGKVPGLKVPARTSSFYFKGRNLPMAEIAKQLGVAYVIEGSVQRAGDRVKISARLSKAADGFQVWADSFTRDAKDVFAVEEEIAELIAKQLSLKLGATSTSATASVNPQALEFYLQATQLMRLRDTIFMNTEHVEDLLNRALALEPNFARAQQMLAMTWIGRGGLQNSAINRFGQRHSPEQARIEAKVRQAIALDPTSPDGHLALALGRWIWWNRAGAEEELRTVLSLNPSDARAHRALGYTAMDDGRMDDAIAEMKLAEQLDPFSQDVIESGARVLHVAGRYTEAIAMYDRALALGDSLVAREHKAYALAQLGQKDAAITLARDLPFEVGQFRPLAAAGARADAEKVFPTTEPQNRAYYLLMLGRTKEGLDALDPGEMQSTYIHDVLYEPWFDPVRDDPRFKKILETLGMSDAHARAQAWRAAHPAEKATTK